MARRRLEADWKGVSASILEGIDEMLTVTRLGLPRELRRSLACTNIIENVMGTVRRVCRNVKYWRSPSMALRWTAAAMQEAKKGFRRLKAYKHLPALRVALAKQGQQPPRSTAPNPHFRARGKGAGSSRERESSGELIERQGPIWVLLSATETRNPS